MFEKVVLISPNASQSTKVIRKSADNLDMWLFQKYPEITVHPLRGRLANDTLLRRLMNKLTRTTPAENILITYFGHGEPDHLVGDESIIGNLSGPLLTINEDLSFLGGTTFLSIACMSGKKFGPALVESGVSRFIGFNDNIYVDTIMSRNAPGFMTVRNTQDTVDIYTYVPKCVIMGKRNVLERFQTYLVQKYPGNHIAEAALLSVVECPI